MHPNQKSELTTWKLQGVSKASVLYFIYIYIYMYVYITETFETLIIFLCQHNIKKKKTKKNVIALS